MAGDGFAVDIKNYAQFRRDLRAIAPSVGRELQGTIRSAVNRVAQEAARTAPRRTGALAASYRPFTNGNLAGVRSRLPYAPVIEYGGTIRPRGTEIRFQRREVVTRAAEREADRVANEIAEGFEDVAREHGWH